MGNLYDNINQENLVSTRLQDKINYSRYLSIYYAMMSRLEKDHPDIYNHFFSGRFSVQIGTFTFLHNLSNLQKTAHARPRRRLKSALLLSTKEPR